MSFDTAVTNLRFSALDLGFDKLFGLQAGQGRFHRSRRKGDTSPASAVAGLLNVRANPLEKSVAHEHQRAEQEGVRTAVAAPDQAAEVALPGQVAVSSADQDRALVGEALRGNQAAFGELVTRYQGAVFNLAYRMLGDPSDAEDAAQEVFVRAWNQLHTFQMERRFSTWLLSIASHHAIDLLRRRKPSAPLDGVALYVQSDEPEPVEVVLEGEQRDLVKSVLNALPEKYRVVTVLRYYNGLSYDEIAQQTGLTESAVKTQLHRARRMLADLLLKRRAAEGEAGTSGSPEDESRAPEMGGTSE